MKKLLRGENLKELSINYSDQNKLMEMKMIAEITEKNGDKVLPFSWYAFNRAIVHNNLETFKWLVSEGVIPGKKEYDTALAYDRQELVDFILSVNDNIMPDIETARTAMYQLNLPLIKLLFEDYNLFLDDPAILDDIIYNNFMNKNTEKIIDILNWFATISPPLAPVLPTRRGARNAANTNNIEILEWLSQQNPPIYPNIHDISPVNEKTLRWLHSKNL